MICRSLVFVGILLLGFKIQIGQSSELNLRNYFSRAIKTPQDQTVFSQIEQHLPKFVDLDLPSTENVDKVFDKFKEAIRLVPATIQPDTQLNADSARDLFPALQPIYRYVKESVWKSILKLVNLPDQILRIPAQNLADSALKKFLTFSDGDTVSKVLEVNSNRRDFSDEQKSILVENYIDKIKDTLNPGNFQELITQKLGASFLRYLPLEFLSKNSIFNDNGVLRNAATWLHLLNPTQRDAIANKFYKSLFDSTGRIAQGNGPLSLSSADPSSLDMIARVLPSLSTRQIINTVGDKIVPLLERSSLRDDQSCSTALALLNRTVETKRTSNRYFRPDPQMIQRWQECYSGCDLRELFSNREDLKELLKHHPQPEICDDLIGEVKKEYDLERELTPMKLREVSDVFGSLYRADEINNLSDDLMAELGRDEKVLEQIGSQDLTANEARSIINKIPRSTQNLWGKSMLGKLGNLIPGLDNTILKQSLTRGRGELPVLFNNATAPFIRKLIPSKIRLLIDQYATDPNLAKYRQLLNSDYAKRFIKSETLMKILSFAPDVLRLIRLTPAQASAAIGNRLGSEGTFDGTLGSLSAISNFINGLTKSDVERIRPEESLQAVQQIFGSSRNRNFDNQMQSNTRFAFGNLLRRGLQNTETAQNPTDYIKGLFRDDNLVDDLNPQLFTTMNNAELDAISSLDSEQGNRFWNSVGLIREPVCCSLTNDNRFRLADYALKHYGSATGEIDNFKLSQLGPFLSTSLRASDIRRITTDALMNKIQYFKSPCFQPDKAEAQALGAKLNDALNEVDDTLKSLYLDLIGELAAYLPMEISAPKKVLSSRANFLSKSLDKLRNRDERCQISDKDGFLKKSIQGVKQSLANAFIDQYSSMHHSRKRRQTTQTTKNFTYDDLRRLGSAISALSVEQISAISDDVFYNCIGVFGSIDDFQPEKLRTIAEKYLSGLQARGRHLQSLSQSELYEINSILTGMTPGQLSQIRDEHFHDGNFLSFIGNLNGWTLEQLQSLSQIALRKYDRPSPSFIENAGKLHCAVDERYLRAISQDDIKSYLPILANVECPNESNVNYSSTMFDIVRDVFKGDLLRPSIFGSLGTIAAGLKDTDIGSLSSNLFNFFPAQALSRLSPNILKSFTNEQLQNLNIEQIKTIPNNLFDSLNKPQRLILEKILNPFKTSGATLVQTISTFSICLVSLFSILIMLPTN